MSEDCKPGEAYGVRIDRLEERVGRVEDDIDRVERDVSDVKTEQAETRVYVRQIFERIDDLKAMISSGGKQQTQWIEFAKWILGGTIFVIVAYLFTGGNVQ